MLQSFSHMIDVGGDLMKILLAEDDLRLARAVKRVFEEEQHAVKIVGSGTAALQAGMDDSYDVMMLDVMLPEMGGFEVSRTMLQQSSELPVLILTARTGVDARCTGLPAGTD